MRLSEPSALRTVSFLAIAVSSESVFGGCVKPAALSIFVFM